MAVAVKKPAPQLRASESIAQNQRATAAMATGTGAAPLSYEAYAAEAQAQRAATAIERKGDVTVIGGRVDPNVALRRFKWQQMIAEAEAPPKAPPPPSKAAVASAPTSAAIARISPAQPAPVPVVPQAAVAQALAARAGDPRLNNAVLEKLQPGAPTQMAQAQAKVQFLQTQVVQKQQEAARAITSIRASSQSVRADIAGIDAQLAVETRPVRIAQLKVERRTQFVTLENNRKQEERVAGSATKEIQRIRGEMNAQLQSVRMSAQARAKGVQQRAAEKAQVSEIQGGYDRFADLDGIAGRLGMGTRSDIAAHLENAEIFDINGAPTFDRDTDIPTSTMTPRQMAEVGMADDFGLSRNLQALDVRMKLVTDKRRTLAQLYTDFGDERLKQRLERLEPQYKVLVDAAVRVHNTAQPILNPTGGAGRPATFTAPPTQQKFAPLPPATPLPYSYQSDNIRAVQKIPSTAPQNNTQMKLLAEAAKTLATTAEKLADEYQWKDIMQSYRDPNSDVGSSALPEFAMRSQLPSGQPFLDAIQNGPWKSIDIDSAVNEVHRRLQNIWKIGEK